MPFTSRAKTRPSAEGGVADMRHLRPHHPPPQQQHRNRSIYTSDSDDDEQQPAAKRRKLSIRGKRQSTLDHYTTTIAQSASPDALFTIQPPAADEVTARDKTNTTANGAPRDELDGTSDLGLPTPRGTTPASTSIPTNATAQPALAKKEEKRTLRSQDEGLPRLKSELAVYFPNYEDVIFDVPGEEEFITVDTVFHPIDEGGSKGKTEQLSPAKGKGAHNNRRQGGAVNGTASPANASAQHHFNGSPVLNFSSISQNLPDHPNSPDPLSAEHYAKSHRRAERKEKQLRNIEKERAMHEKVQLDRLLDGLLGHDWLKVLGITGITEGEARKFEAKRDYFVAEVQALVDKFRQWKEMEKRLKVRRERAIAAAEEESEGEGSVEPPSSEVNDSAARQLQQETASAIKLQRQGSSGSGFKIKLASTKGKNLHAASSPHHTTTNSTPSSSRVLPPPPPPPLLLTPEEPITSFYTKRHLRDAALGKVGRHNARNSTAFGHAVPEVEVREFALPGEYVSAEVLRANARSKRRRRRERESEG